MDIGVHRPAMSTPPDPQVNHGARSGLNDRFLLSGHNRDGDAARRRRVFASG
jgi:hypothetical protein